MKAYYNEIEPYPAQWLRNLMAEGLISEGDVDERDIKEVQPQDLEGYTRCHFFAGIAGWDYALQLAGWPADEPVWTGSCPCQPFSAAGKRRGTDDPRHLWPVWRGIIEVCRPPVIFGEQVASAGGREWLSGVRADLEALGYAVGAADMCAASVGAPHIRQRLWWVADAQDADGGRSSEEDNAGRWVEEARRPSAYDGIPTPIQTSISTRPQKARWLVYTHGRLRGPGGPQCHVGHDEDGYWESYEWVATSDGRQFRVEPGVAPLAHGVPNRVGKLRAYGNAIVPQVAAEFIRAYMEIV